MSKNLIYAYGGVIIFLIIFIGLISSFKDDANKNKTVPNKVVAETAIIKEQDDETVSLLSEPIIEPVTTTSIIGSTTNNMDKVSTSSITPPITKPIAIPTVEVVKSEPVPQFTFYEISNVVDGDTVKINIDGQITTLRLIGIDTPETVDPRKEVQCFGIEASNKAKELLIGKKVRIEKDTTQGELDKYGRLLAYIYREDGLFFNKYMIEQGYAHEYTYNTPYRYQNEFKTAQGYAQTNKLGLWSPNTCNGDTTSSAKTSQTTSPTTSSGMKYYTSSASNASKYYPETCSAWQNLSKSNLRTFNSLEELLSVHPSRTLAETCK